MRCELSQAVACRPPVVTSVNNFRGYLPYVHQTLTHMEMIGEWAAGGHGEEEKRLRPAFERDLRAEGLGFRYEGSDAAGTIGGPID